MNARIARKRLHISKKRVRALTAEFNALNAKAARRLGIYDKIFWLYPIDCSYLAIAKTWVNKTSWDKETRKTLEHLAESSYAKMIEISNKIMENS